MWQFKMSADIPQFQDGSSAKVTFSWTWVQCELEVGSQVLGWKNLDFDEACLENLAAVW